MTQPRTVVDIVGSEARPHELLEQVRLLVRALRGAEARQRLGAAQIANRLQARRSPIERFLPRGFAEMRPGVGGVDLVVGVFLDVIEPYQRLREAMRMVHVIESEPAL